MLERARRLLARAGASLRTRPPAMEALQGVAALVAVGAGVELEWWGLAAAGGLLFLDYAAGAWPRSWRRGDPPE